MKGPHCFPKAEKMVSRKAIEELFTSGSKSLTIFPIRLVYRKQESPSPSPVSVLVSVSKRKLHHAVDRNRAKRQIREAYRLHKELITHPVAKMEGSLSLACIWLSDNPMPTAKVQSSLRKLLQSVSEQL